VILEDSPETRAQAAEVIAQGGVIAFRTDTFYGLGADPFNRRSVDRIKQLKGREGKKPILIVISDREQLRRLIAGPSQLFIRLAEQFWPGPVTLIGNATSEVPEAITAGSGTVGVRLPDDHDVRELLRVCGGALTATSANPSNDAPSRTAPEVDAYFGSKINLIVDGGEARIDRPSTVVDVTGTEAKLVREGVIAWSEIVE
jgi:L-threonylcarbamoyladenylate synthase